MATVKHTPTMLQAENFGIQAKILMLREGVTVTALAKRVKRSRTAVSLALNHATMLPKVKKLIRKELGIR